MPYKDPKVRAQYHRDYAEVHKGELQVYRNQYRAEHPEEEKVWQEVYRGKSIEKRKEYTRYYRYGVDVAKFNELLSIQDNSCAICKTVFTKTPHIDHCHTTGKVRGLLCSPCNTGLGIYEKKSILFKRYLDEYQ